MTARAAPGAPRGLDRKRVLITGAASGIGQATARTLAGDGARIALADRNLPGATEAAAGIRRAGGESMAMPLDVTSPEEWQATVDRIAAAWGGLDALVHCAGITDDAPLQELSLERWRRVLAVNLDGAFLATRSGIRAMTPAGEGSIVHVASIAGIRAYAGAPAYCASKAALIQLTRVAALECARAGTRIRVNCVAPGGVKTPMWEQSSHWPAITETEEWKAPETAPSLKRFAAPEEIARTILFLAGDGSSYMNGAILVVDGGASI